MTEESMKVEEQELWVWMDLRTEKSFSMGLGVLALARNLSESLHAKNIAVLMGPSVEGSWLSMAEASESSVSHGADKAYVFQGPPLETFLSSRYAAVLAQGVRNKRPKLVLAGLNDFGREVLAQAAALTRSGMIAECHSLRFEKGMVLGKSPSWGGEIFADITFSGRSETGFATIAPQGHNPLSVPGNPGRVETIEANALDTSDGITFLSRVPIQGDKEELEQANTVVVGGAGLRDENDFHLLRELAVNLGGKVAGTRPTVLKHWLDEDQLIGQTGKKVSPNLLLSIGTSGAIQYTAGITGAKKIVAINRDKRALIFRLAHIGVVADVKTFLPLLAERIKKRMMRDLADSLTGDVSQSDKARSGFGARIQALRKAHDWTLDALAESTGQSAEFLEKVEKDEISPPMAFLLRLASELNVDARTFLREKEEAQIRDMRAQAFARRTRNASYETLTPGEDRDHVQAFLVTVDPMQRLKPVAYKHEGEEFIFVLSGELEVIVGNKVKTLVTGESIYFHSEKPHKLRSLSSEPTRFVTVIYNP
jgi:electron transfer flavoprotein alpha subunit/transcriptional regulator with XRE-family HTH domain